MLQDLMSLNPKPCGEYAPGGATGQSGSLKTGACHEHVSISNCIGSFEIHGPHN